MTQQYYDIEDAPRRTALANNDLVIGVAADGSPIRIPPALLEGDKQDITGLATKAELTAEQNARTDADNALSTRINSKADDAALSSEIRTRTDQNVTLQQALSRKAEATALQAEVTNRTNADAALRQAIDQKADSSALSTERTERANADTALGVRIDGKLDKTDFDVLNNRFTSYYNSLPIIETSISPGFITQPDYSGQFVLSVDSVNKSAELANVDSFVIAVNNIPVHSGLFNVNLVNLAFFITTAEGSRIGASLASIPDTITFQVRLMNGGAVVQRINHELAVRAQATGSGTQAPTNLAIGRRAADSLELTSSTGTNATIPVATKTLAGLLEADDKTKLDTIAENAQQNRSGQETIDIITQTLGRSNWQDPPTPSSGNTDLSITNRQANSLTIASSSGTNATIPVATENLAGLLSAGDKAVIDRLHNLSGTSITEIVAGTGLSGGGSSGAVTINIENPFTADDKTKLDGIEANATADQTPTEIRDALQGLTGDDRLDVSAIKGIADQHALLEVASDSTLSGKGTTDDPLKVTNPFTTEDNTKLASIEFGATADQTPVEIRNALGSLTGDDRLDASHIKNIPSTGGQGGPGANLSIGSRTATSLEIVSDSGSNAQVPTATTSLAGLLAATDKTKLDGIESGATEDQTPVEIRQALERLIGDNRLPASAVKDLPDPGTKVEANDTIRALDGGRLRNIFIAGTGYYITDLPDAPSANGKYELQIADGVPTWVPASGVPIPTTPTLRFWLQDGIAPPAQFPAGAGSTTGTTFTIPSFTGEKYLIIAQRADVADITQISIDHFPQFGAFTKHTATISGEGQEYWITNDSLTSEAIGGHVEVER